jgi:hypothetical protein
MRFDNLPACCRKCHNLDSEYSELSEMSFWYCEKNVWWPHKKQTCKKQRPYKDRLIADCRGEG